MKDSLVIQVKFSRQTVQYACVILIDRLIQNCVDFVGLTEKTAYTNSYKILIMLILYVSPATYGCRCSMNYFEVMRHLYKSRSVTLFHYAHSITSYLIVKRLVKRFSAIYIALIFIFIIFKLTITFYSFYSDSI